MDVFWGAQFSVCCQSDPMELDQLKSFIGKHCSALTCDRSRGSFNVDEQTVNLRACLPARFVENVREGSCDMDCDLRVNISENLAEPAIIRDVEILELTSIQLSEQEQVYPTSWSCSTPETRPWLYDTHKVVKLIFDSGSILLYGHVTEFESMGQAPVCHSTVQLESLTTN
jgi:hypothetical protein